MRSRYFLATILAAASITAYADTISTFNLTGTLVNGGALSGTLQVDITTGVFTGANFTAGEGSTTYTFTSDAVTPGPIPSVGYGATYFGSLGSFFALSVPESTMIGYTGSSICSGTQPCNLNRSGLFDSGSRVDVVSVGSLTPASTVTPEPSTVVLFGTGLLGLAGAVKRRFV